MNKSPVVRYLTVSYPTRVSARDIHEIMCTAVGGGITYWCDHIEPDGGNCSDEQNYEPFGKDGVLRIYVAEPFEKKCYELTQHKFLVGLRTWLESNPEVLICGWDCYEIDCGKIDPQSADCIIQLALFGEIVFS